ncbi:chloroplast sensor kinase, chloroplastic isoform X2 [Olea europaea var. sylvestris]|uniref:Chloroplast sensor kinase, chloroplastic n=1 Tax=Olea europaea subsp. europaea TaxID=158383 RepID=A0A8S0VJM7_OLEEU|nr:chloroplast sensor kinase, chloroplastic isoform X2 [Olea europaea var. sylvestris]CAA3030554.1 chloroplast sensor kinase, chloroplastic [Olea europaea subsp. europaea]
MLLSTFPPQTPLSDNSTFAPIFSLIYNRPRPSTFCTATAKTSQLSVANSSNSNSSTLLHHVNSTGNEAGDSGEAEPEHALVSSAAAVAAAIRKASTSPVEFVQRIEKDGAKNKALILPSSDFQRICLEQLDLFRRIVDSEALLSIYVRPAGSYVMDRLELRRITFYPDVNVDDIVVLIGNFSIPAGLRVAEAAISSKQAELFPELGAVVFPMVKHPFVVGFLVAERPEMAQKRELFPVKESSVPGQSFALPHSVGSQSLDIQNFGDHSSEISKFTRDQQLNAINITSSLAMAYVMDQKALLLQQSSWQNNVRMNNLVEQIRGSLLSIQTLSKMLRVHTSRSEISYDIVEDILVQGDHMRDTLRQLQDAVHLTKANIMRYNSEKLKKMHQSTGPLQDSMNSQLSNNSSAEISIHAMQESGRHFSISSPSRDLEFPMPPLALSPSCQQGIRPCSVTEVLEDLVRAIEPLAHNQQRAVKLCELSRSLEAAVEEPALRQALSNLIEGALLRTEVGGKVEIVSTGAPAGGALIIIDDDGPDMHYMTQLHSLAPFGTDLFSKDMIEDNMTWNFIAGLTVAREILENYGCVIRVMSPRNTDAALGAGGTRVELWLPSFSASSSDVDGSDQEA